MSSASWDATAAQVPLMLVSPATKDTTRKPTEPATFANPVQGNQETPRTLPVQMMLRLDAQSNVMIAASTARAQVLTNVSDAEDPTEKKLSLASANASFAAAANTQPILQAGPSVPIKMSAVSVVMQLARVAQVQQIMNA